jgi:hypothetical protein
VELSAQVCGIEFQTFKLVLEGRTKSDKQKGREGEKKKRGKKTEGGMEGHRSEQM